MTDLAETALAFCQQCLGWDDASSVNDWGHIYVRRARAKTFSPMPHSRGDFFHPTDLNQVMEAVRVWCVENGRYAQLQANEYSVGWYKAFVGQRDVRAEWRNMGPEFTNPCHALLAACVEANRKLEGITDAA